MKILKNISICLVISLAAFVSVEKDCFSYFSHSIYVIENTSCEEKPSNVITPDYDSPGVDVMLTPSIYSFNLKYLSGEKVTIPGSYFPQNIYFCIWQPPKISWI